MSIMDMFRKKKDEPNTMTITHMDATLFFNALNTCIIGSWESDKYVRPITGADRLAIAEVEDNRWK